MRGVKSSGGSASKGAVRRFIFGLRKRVCRIEVWVRQIKKAKINVDTEIEMIRMCDPDVSRALKGWDAGDPKVL